MRGRDTRTEETKTRNEKSSVPFNVSLKRHQLLLRSCTAVSAVKLTAGQKDTEPAKMQEPVVESPQVLPLSLPHYVGQPGSNFLSHDYHSLGYFLRSNIFPGVSFPWKSTTKETYISHPVTARPADPKLWPGRIKDEMTQWREKNIMERNINKMLAEREKKGPAK